MSHGYRTSPMLYLSSSWVRRIIVIIGILLALSILLNQQFGFLVPPDKSVLTGAPCSPPCWYGVTPGKTTLAEARKVLLSSPHVIKPSVSEERSKVVGLGVRWATAARKLGTMTVMSGTVQHVGVEPDFDLRLGELVRSLGEPARVQIWASLYGSEQLGFSVNVIYPRLGLVALLQPQTIASSREAKLTPDLPIKELYYLVPASNDELLRLQIPSNEFTGALWLLNKVPQEAWRGFVEYRILPMPE